MAKRILLAEDEPAIARLVEFKLAKEGYHVTCASDGKTALKMAKEGQFDLLLLDVLMPKLDGFQVLERVRSDPALKDIPVVLLTAKGQEEDRARGTELGATDYIIKLFNPQELAERIGRILEVEVGPGEDSARR
jgi:DNA-binding response OmpR family regulator